MRERSRPPGGLLHVTRKDHSMRVHISIKNSGRIFRHRRAAGHIPWSWHHKKSGWKQNDVQTTPKALRCGRCLLISGRHCLADHSSTPSFITPKNDSERVSVPRVGAVAHLRVRTCRCDPGDLCGGCFPCQSCGSHCLECIRPCPSQGRVGTTVTVIFDAIRSGLSRGSFSGFAINFRWLWSVCGRMLPP